MAKRPPKPPTPPPAPLVLNMVAASWRVLFSVGVPPSPTQVTPDSWSLPFPRLEDGSGNKLNYLLCEHTAKIVATHLEYRVKVTASPSTVFDFKTEASNTGTAPAAMRAIIWRETTTEYGRWWCNPRVGEPIQHVVLAGGEFVMRLPINPDAWTSVYGRRGTDDAASLAGWNTAINSPAFIGFTFGGGSFFSHGVRTNGPAASLEVTGVRLVSDAP